MSECIYKFVEQPRPENPKKHRYRSKYDPNAPLIGSTFGMHGTTAVDGKGYHALKEVSLCAAMRAPLFLLRKCTFTSPRDSSLLTVAVSVLLTKNHVVTSSFGIKPEAPNPRKFLRKGSLELRSEANIPSVEHHNRSKESHKPQVPSRNEAPVHGLKTSKNFVNCNAVEAISSVPKKLNDNNVRLHDEYGKVPAYLETVKAAIGYEKELVDRYVAEQFGQPIVGNEENEMMDERERMELINKLKQKWDDVNAVYQKHCHKVMLDTPGEIKRKASQEAELKQLEDFIEKLSRGPVVIKS